MSYMKDKNLQKEGLSAERGSFCRKREFLQIDRKSISYQKVFLPNFCRKFWQKECRKTLSVDHYFPNMITMGADQGSSGKKVGQL